MPEVSVVIPTYGRENLIGPTLAGALGQEDVDLEVIVVVDASPDRTAARLEEIGDPRLRIIVQPVNRGQAAARNRGIAEAAGEWVAFLDDDDIWAPRKLRLQLDAAGRKDADLAFSTALVLDPDLHPIRAFYPPPPSEQPRNILESSSVPAGSSNLVARTELLRQVGGGDEELDALADWDLFIRLLLNGTSAILEEPHVGYVLRSQSVSAALLERHFEDFEVIERKYAAARERYGATLDGVQFSRWLAGGLRRGGRRRDAMRAYLRGAVQYRSFGNLVRCLGVPFGERAMAIARSKPTLPPAPEWIDLYRPGGRLDCSLEQLAAKVV